VRCDSCLRLLIFPPFRPYSPPRNGFEILDPPHSVDSAPLNRITERHILFVCLSGSSFYQPFPLSPNHPPRGCRFSPSLERTCQTRWFFGRLILKQLFHDVRQQFLRVELPFFLLRVSFFPQVREKKMFLTPGKRSALSPIWELRKLLWRLAKDFVHLLRKVPCLFDPTGGFEIGQPHRGLFFEDQVLFPHSRSSAL